MPNLGGSPLIVPNFLIFKDLFRSRSGASFGCLNLLFTDRHTRSRRQLVKVTWWELHSSGLRPRLLCLLELLRDFGELLYLLPRSHSQAERPAKAQEERHDSTRAVKS